MMGLCDARVPDRRRVARPGAARAAAFPERVMGTAPERGARAVRVAGVARTIEVRSNDGARPRGSRALPPPGR